MLEQVGPNLAQPYAPDSAAPSANHQAAHWDNTILNQKSPDDLQPLVVRILAVLIADRSTPSRPDSDGGGASSPPAATSDLRCSSPRSGPGCCG